MKEMITSLFRYNQWANRRILEGALNLNEEQYSAPSGYSHGSLRLLLYHMLRTEWVWRNLAHSGKLTQPPPRPDDFPDRHTLQAHWQEEQRQMNIYLDCLSEADLLQEVQLRDRQGDLHVYTVWQMLSHLLLHSMQHRSEAAALLTGFGGSPGDLDYIFFLDEDRRP